MVELLLLLMNYKHILYIYLYITSMINCHFIMLLVLYKQMSSQSNDRYVMCISTH
jgi:hypothetical protein